MFVGLAEKEAYFKDRVSIFVALAPVTKLPNTEDQFWRNMSGNYNMIEDTLRMLGIHSILNDTWFNSGVTSLTCNLAPWFCLDLNAMMTSGDTIYDSKARF